MRLIGYGPGELIDRLTILQLKILHRPLEHFKTEALAIEQTLNEQVFDQNGFFCGFVTELAAVNAEIWAATDAVRYLRRTDNAITNLNQGLTECKRLLFHLQTLNDRRAELINLINVDAGRAAEEEKI